jgi:hypothetical protein
MPSKASAVPDLGEWIGPLQAVHLLSPKIGGDSKAKAAIAERLKDNAVLATAWWMAEGVDVGLPYREPALIKEIRQGDEAPTWSVSEVQTLRQTGTMPTVSLTKAGDGMAFRIWDGANDDRLILGGHFWGAVRKNDIERWDWANGFFITSCPPGEWKSAEVMNNLNEKFPRRTFALGVRFRRADIESMLGEPAFSAPPLKPVQSTRGAKQSESWPHWVAMLTVLIHEGETFSSARSLVRKVADRLNDAGLPHPSDNTVYAAATAVVDALGRSNLTD